jgi:FMN phosphatase YigB (HAD superfamily)
LPQTVKMTAIRRTVSPQDDVAGLSARDGLHADVEILSCDVFDTLLTRMVGTPQSLFLLLGRRLAARGLSPIGAEAFALLRRDAARRARQNSSSVYTLEDIYREIQFSLGLTTAEREAIQVEELALEAELLRPVPGARERLVRARQAGRRIVFLSDMYIDSEWIQTLLRRDGMAEPGERCYVSCETGVGKANGRAFRILAQREGVLADRILHWGNDLYSDVAGARLAGVRPEYFAEANLSRYEELLEMHVPVTEGLAAAMAGASRMARLEVRAVRPHYAALRDVAAGVGAPALVSYVLWLLLQARQAGTRRLYFMARDGHILMQIAGRLVERLGMQCELRYLYGGRRAWYLPSATDTTPADLFWAIDYAAPVNSVETFLRRLQVEPAEVQGALVSMGLPPLTWQLPRSPAEYELLWSIARHPEVHDLIMQRAAAEREGVLAYLEAEGLLDGGQDWAVVDVGWSGRVVGALSRMLASRGGSLPGAYFFARLPSDTERPVDESVPIRAYFSDHADMRGYRSHVNELFLELFCGAAHGVTLSYRTSADGVRPVLDGDSNPALDAWGLSIVHETMLSFTDHLWLDPETLNLSADMRPAVAEVLQAFIRAPSEAEARAWGAYPFEYGRAGVVSAVIATPLQMTEVPAALLRGHVQSRAGTEWVEARLAMAPWLVRRSLRFGMALRRRLGALLRRVRS